MRLEITLCTALAALTLGLEPVEAQDRNARDDAVAEADREDDLILSERREELIQDADQALDRLRRQNENAAALLDVATVMPSSIRPKADWSSRVQGARASRGRATAATSRS